MAKCLKCGLINEKGSSKCINCGTRFFMGMTVTRTYRYSPSQKFLLNLIKYSVIIFGVFMFYNSLNGEIDFNVFLYGDFKSILMALGVMLFYFVFNIPVFAILYFVYKLVDFALDNSEHPESVNQNEP